MSDRLPHADEAARALRDVGQRRDQAVRESTQESRWVGVVFAIALFAQLAAPDFFGEKVRPWMSWSVFALLMVYMVLLRTRRGSDLLGRPARPRKSEISRRFAYFARLAIAVVMVLGFIAALYGGKLLFPYAGTVLGAVLCGGLIAFGPTLQKGLNSLATRRQPDDSGVLHGSR
ncbi:hypothetical protein [Streptomyces sp. NBC_01187]|uniref:hypothetical protein n=1 Tax=Streptomyces sp. NBC_01187 TaxID=2903766 RepID=UPI00386B6E00|nr:hypothetical protein OG220_21965 [Streptomyces sp. NBC_01187]